MRSVTPVFTEEEVSAERTLALDRPEYFAVIALPITLQVINPTTFEQKRYPDWGLAVRFELSDEDRAAIAAGADLVITELVFGKQMTPLNIQLCKRGERPILQTEEDVKAMLEKAQEEAAGEKPEDEAVN